MGHDSSDFMACNNCECYEIDQRGQCSGIEAGIMNCLKHNFCVNCFPEAFKKIEDTFTDVEYIKKYGSRYFEYDGLTDESTDEEILEKFDKTALSEHYAEEGIPEELCPLCAQNHYHDREVLSYVLEQMGKTKKEVCEEMKQNA